MENNSFGAIVVHELKTGGASIPVTEENKREYVKLYVNYRFMRGIEQQFLWLQKGIRSKMVPNNQNAYSSWQSMAFILQVFVI